MKNNRSSHWGILLLLAILCSFNAKAQESVKINGKVSDPAGEAIIGGSVVVKGTSIGIMTDAEGKYTLSVPNENSVLVFTYIGSATQEIQVGSQRTINVVMEEEAYEFDEVVIVGYGVQKKRDVTGSISSLKSRDVTALPTGNALESMQGKVAGLDMNRSSGEIGSGVTFSLRGNRSLNASNEPLILVDGIPYGSNMDINPSDIQSMEILKDASSTAIYGTRGANGVVLITTKKGSAGQTKVAFNAFAGFRQVTGQPNIMNGPEFVEFRREAFRTTGVTDDTKIFSPSELEYINNGYFTNWGDLLLRTGSIQNYELAITGGTDKTQATFSFGYNKETGLIRLEDLQRYNARIGVDHALLPNLKLGASILYTYRDVNNRRDPLNMAYKIRPISRPYDDNGAFVLFPAPGQTSFISPLADEQPRMYVNNTMGKRMFGTGYLDWKIHKDWFFKSTFGADMIDNRRGWYYGKSSIDGGNNWSQSGIEVGNNIVSNTSSAPGTGNSVNLTWENVLNYSKDFGIHGIQALVGTSTIYNRNEAYGASGKNQISPLNQFWDLGSNISEYQIASDLSESSLASFFGRVNYKLRDKYLLSASMRADGASTLAPGNKWGYFPSVALGWKMKEEEFLREVAWLHDLKLRLSWGRSGNSAISPYQTKDNLKASTYAFGETPAFGFFPYGLANYDLSWEITTTFNAGVDFSLVRGRVSGSIDAYIANTSDLLMPRKVSSSSGFIETIQNVGQTRNTGVELGLHTANLAASSPLQWSTDITLAHNKEEIVALAGGVTRDVANGWFVGYPTQVWYDYKKIGIWQLGEEAEAAKNNQKPGDIRVETQNADGKVTDEDRQILGSTRPKINIGLNNRFEFKNFDLNIFIYAKFGQLIATEALGNYKIDARENGIKADFWTPENPTNAYPRPNSSTSAANTFAFSTLSYVRGDFLKIPDITLGYTLPSTLSQQIKISSVRVYASMRNFFTFADKRLGSFDPERNMSGSKAVSFPLTREVVFGLNFNF